MLWPGPAGAGASVEEAGFVVEGIVVEGAEDFGLAVGVSAALWRIRSGWRPNSTSFSDRLP